MGTMPKNVKSMLLSFRDWSLSFGRVQENKTKVYVDLEKVREITFKINKM